MTDLKNREHTAFLRALFAALDTSGLSYCVLRNWDGLPDTCGNDLDLFVPPDQLGQVAERMIAVAAEQGHVLCSKTEKYGFCSFDFLKWDRQARLKIDLFTKIHFQGLSLLETDEVLQELRTHDGIAVAGSVVESFINATKDMLDSGAIKDKYRAAITSGLDSELGSRRLTQLLDRAVGRKGRAIILDHLAGFSSADPAAYAALRRSFRRQQYRRAPLRSLAGQASAIWHRWRAGRRHVRSSRLTIAMLGPDGSGKSTVSRMIRENLICPGQHVHYRHGRPGHIPDLRDIVNFLRRGFGLKPLAANPKGEKAVHDRVHSPFLASLYLIYYGFDFWIEEFRFRLWHGAHVRIFDRYWYDYFFLPSFANLPRVFRSWLYLLPRADLLLVLVAEPEEIFSRKPELTIAQIEQQNVRALIIASSVREARIIRTDQGMHKTLGAIAREIGRSR